MLLNTFESSFRSFVRSFHYKNKSSILNLYFINAMQSPYIFVSFPVSLLFQFRISYGRINNIYI